MEAESVPIRDVDSQAVVFTQHFTSGPPTTLARQNDDVDTIAVEKQEEWIKKRKVEQVTTKQIETRVKRQVIVTEDGQVVDDSGPQVTTRTTEDTETKREEHTEKTGGDEDGTVALPPEGWVAIPGAVIVREKHEKKSNTRDEIDERLETEEVHHLGHLTHQELEEALEKHHETGEALTWRRRSSDSGSSNASESGQRQLVAPYTTGKRVVHQSRKHKRIIDQENTEERSEEKDGRITTETKRHEHHEEIDDDEQPDDERPASDTSSIHEVVKETRNNYTTIQDEDQVEYIAVPKGGNVASGVKLGHGPRQTTQKTVQYEDGQEKNADAVEQDVVGIKQSAEATGSKAQQPIVDERTDALTKKPLDLEAEEETRKLETSRWLESHFGSESSHSSEGGNSAKGRKKEEKMPSQVFSGGINVTMTSDPQSGGSDRYDPNPSAPEPFINSRIYAQTGGLSGFNRPTQQNARFGQSSQPTSPPQSPTYKSTSTSGYQSAMNNGHKPGESAVKRATSFNQSTGNYSWMNKEELKGHQSSARHSFLTSMNRQQQPEEDGPTYAAPIQKRWPPPKPIDEDEDVRTSTPVYQTPQKPNRGGGTIIRLGPSVETNGQRKYSGSGITRTQSLFQKQTDVANSNAQTNRMNMLNSSLQSVPERGQRNHYSPPQRSLFVDTERSFQSLNPSGMSSNPKVIQSYTIKTPPPRPAPPSHYGSPAAILSPHKLRASESFRFPRSPPMFADDLTSPPVRPVRRKSKRAAKTDSGTQCNPQTIRNEIIQQQQQSQTLDRPGNKPMKKYYLGEDPFHQKAAMNGQVHHLSTPVQQEPRRAEVNRSQTLPRRPSKPLLNDSSSSRVFSDQDRSLNETSGLNNNRTGRIIPIAPAVSTSSVNRSQSFHVENQSASGQRRTSLLNSTPLRSVSIRTANNSPLYKSTSFLNRSNEHQPFASLKSPGIVTSISKSQLDLNNISPVPAGSNNNINNSALYTLPRRRSSSSAKVVPPPIDISVGKVQAGISERLAQLSPTALDSPGARGESFSSLHRRKMQAASSSSPAPVTPPPPPPPPQPESPLAKSVVETPIALNLSSSTKSIHRNYRGTNETIKEENEMKMAEPELEPEARSLKDRIALLENAGIHYANPAQTLPRVVGGKTKAPPPPPPPRVSSALQTRNKEGSPEVESVEKRQKFLEGLLNTAPELFMHIHGNENLKDMRMSREDVIDGKSGRLPRTPSPSTGYNNRVFTSTPSSNHKANNPFGSESMAPLTPPPLLIRSSASPFGSQRDLALRRGSLNSTGSGNNNNNMIAAVKIPAAVNYSETVRIKSNQDPDSQSDSVQSYSKRVQPFVDGFSSETKQSSQQTTLTRSQYTDRRGSTDGSTSPYYHSIRPQQSGGVIIQVRGSGQ